MSRVGGGSVTIPYAHTPEGELLVALIKEQRANMGEEAVWCVIGGFIDPGETHRQAQAREAAEEAGIRTTSARQLPGLCTNANRAFFVADAAAGEGVHAYGFEFPFNLLEVEGSNYKLKDSALIVGIKKPDDLRFFPWRNAIISTPDALARSAIAQLLVAMI